MDHTILDEIFVVLIAWLLIFIEFYVPGGIMALLGSSLILFSIYLHAQTAAHLGDVLLFAAIALAGVAAVVRLALYRIKKSQGPDGVYLNKDQEGYRSSSYESSLIGKEGIAITGLRPSGYVKVGDKRLTASSLTGFIPKGHKIKIVSGEGANLNVVSMQED